MSEIDASPQTFSIEQIEEIRQWQKGALERIGGQPAVVQRRMFGLVRFEGAFTETSYVSVAGDERTVCMWQGVQTNRLTGKTTPVETINLQTYDPREKEDGEVGVDLSTGSVFSRESGLYVTPYLSQAYTDIIIALRGAGWGKMDHNEQA